MTIRDTRLELYLHERGQMNRLRSHPIPDSADRLRVVELDRVWLSDPHFFPVTGDGSTFMHVFQVYAPNKYRDFFGAEVAAHVSREAHRFERAGTLADVVAVGGTTTYYHWLLDHLPRLFVLACEPDLRGRRVLVNAAPVRFQIESCRLFCARYGIAPPELQPCPPDGLFPVRRAVLPGRVDRAGAVRLLARLGNAPPAAPRLDLFIRRRGAAYRRLLNEEEVGEALGPGFVPVDPSVMGFDEQVAVFSRARRIVGAHGAALANAVFAPPDAALVEIWSGLRQPHYADIARHKGLRYVAVEGTPVPGTHERIQHCDFRVDPDAVRTAVEGIARAR